MGALDPTADRVTLTMDRDALADASPPASSSLWRQRQATISTRAVGSGALRSGGRARTRCANRGGVVRYGDDPTRPSPAGCGKAVARDRRRAPWRAGMVPETRIPPTRQDAKHRTTLPVAAAERPGHSHERTTKPRRRPRPVRTRRDVPEARSWRPTKTPGKATPRDRRDPIVKLASLSLLGSNCSRPGFAAPAGRSRLGLLRLHQYLARCWPGRRAWARAAPAPIPSARVAAGVAGRGPRGIRHRRWWS